MYYDVLRAHWENTHREYVDASFNPGTVNIMTTLLCNVPGTIHIEYVHYTVQLQFTLV